jgi:hypothetical protein
MTTTTHTLLDSIRHLAQSDTAKTLLRQLDILESGDDNWELVLEGWSAMGYYPGFHAWLAVREGNREALIAAFRMARCWTPHNG